MRPTTHQHGSPVTLNRDSIRTNVDSGELKETEAMSEAISVLRGMFAEARGKAILFRQQATADKSLRELRKLRRQEDQLNFEIDCLNAVVDLAEQVVNSSCRT